MTYDNSCVLYCAANSELIGLYGKVPNNEGHFSLKKTHKDVPFENHIITSAFTNAGNAKGSFWHFIFALFTGRASIGTHVKNKCRGHGDDNKYDTNQRRGEERRGKFVWGLEVMISSDKEAQTFKR